METICNFNVRPKPSTLYYVTIRLFKDLESLHKYAEGKVPSWAGDAYLGACISSNMENRFAEVLLSVGHLNEEIITHECCHAGFGYLAR